MLKVLEIWLDVRSGELKKIGLCFSGAFVLLALVMLARAMREGIMGPEDVFANSMRLERSWIEKR